MTVGAVGDSVVVYHPYCMGLPEQPFKQFFAKTGATEFGYWQYQPTSGGGYCNREEAGGHRVAAGLFDTDAGGQVPKRRQAAASLG